MTESISGTWAYGVEASKRLTLAAYFELIGSVALRVGVKTDCNAGTVEMKEFCQAQHDFFQNATSFTAVFAAFAVVAGVEMNLIASERVAAD